MVTFFKPKARLGPPTPVRLSSSPVLMTTFCGVNLTFETGPTRTWRAWAIVALLRLIAAWLVLTCFAVLFQSSSGVFVCLCVNVLLGWALGMAHLICWFFPEGPLFRVGASGEALAARALGFGSETTVGGRSVEEVGGKESHEMSRAVRKWVQRTKLHFGTVGNKSAEVVCVSRWLAEEMKKEDMRDVDARRLVPLVARLAAIPDADDIFAAAIMQTAAVRMARQLGESTEA